MNCVKKKYTVDFRGKIKFRPRKVNKNWPKDLTKTIETGPVPTG